jgi:hypothetical protein
MIAPGRSVAEERPSNSFLSYLHRGATCPCPECGGRGCRAPDAGERTWLHLSLLPHEIHRHVQTPQVREHCGVE